MATKKSVPENKPEDIITALLSQRNKSRKSAYSFFDEEDPAEIKDWISTGSTLLDYAISNKPGGGIPYGRITEISGLESSGKSLLSLHVIANAQKKGGIGILLDTEERRLNRDFLLRLGVDPKKIVMEYPLSIEDSFETIEETIKIIRHTENKRPIVIVWDSISATSPQAEHEGSYDPQSQIGIGAKAVGRGIRKLTHTIGTENIALVIISQLRMNPRALPFTDPYVTPYGKAIPFASSVRLRVTQSTKLKNKDSEIVGVGCNVRVIKNSLGPPNRSVKFPIIYGYGVDDQQSIYDFLKEKKLIIRNDMKLGNEEFKLKESDWKKFFSDPDNKKKVMDVVDSFMIKKYDDVNPKNHLDLDEDLTNTDSED